MYALGLFLVAMGVDSVTRVLSDFVPMPAARVLRRALLRRNFPTKGRSALRASNQFNRLRLQVVMRRRSETQFAQLVF